MVLHVLFTKEGIPAWIGAQPIEGSEAVEGLTMEYLAGHRRTTRGNWVARVAAVPAEPTPEELAARAEADYQAALVERDRALREALAAEADPLFFQWQCGEVEKEAWLAKVVEVKAGFPKPDRI
jgi:hypothetical protein